MKLAEALIERAELKEKNDALVKRIANNTVVQEGDEPAEAPELLISEYEANVERLQTLIIRINRTNSASAFDEERTISDAIAARDCLGAKIRAYRNIYDSAVSDHFRYSAKEIKFVRCVDAKQIQDTIDRLSKAYRELDTKLQGLNWTVELL